ncbi:Oidioi.mRNA.OKI2018_I69.XSR.g16609.t1.cds [Oikopleura dioica]|uniref:Oidioi.mRNA.OKI2018_I69.XSR.g16609.t1.cds n=1 Tax=Oikopleura dioica TaxID=34765 RepID=A0ABN7SGN2_OIKDI|nr:Oidioi.mRNA.OKI2018_I69.XSR.g16609.t1.cds [Oikopleura dioica]
MSSTNVDLVAFENKCDTCTNMCYYAADVPKCVKDCMRENQRSCSNGYLGLIISRGDVGGSYYGGDVYESRYEGITCGGYCYYG